MSSKTRHKQRAGSRPGRPPSAAARAGTGPDAVPAQPDHPRPVLIPPGLARAAAPASRAPDPLRDPVPDPAPGAGGWADALVREGTRQAVTATCWLDPGDSGPAGPVTVRFSGRRTGVTGAAGRGDCFVHEETVDGVLPGSGPVSVTARVDDVNPGEWLVRARVVAQPRHLPGVRQLALPDSASGARALRRILWSKGNPVAPEGPGSPARTRLAAFATGPGIIAASWSAMVLAGVALALGLLLVLLGRVHIAAGPALAVSAAVIVAGAIGSRLWYVMLQRGKTDGLIVRGLCIQGTVFGGALAAIPGLLLAGIPVGTFFDAATPGLFFAMAAGRQGCFLTGCCAGRPTASRWGIWSSDGRIGARRLPAQQFEALAGLLIGAGALAAFLELGRAPGGVIFTGAMAAYILARQGLLALRAEPRRWSLAGPVTLAAAAAALAADIAVAALR